MTIPFGEDSSTPFPGFAFFVQFAPRGAQPSGGGGGGFAPFGGVAPEITGAFSEVSGLEATMEPKAIKVGGKNYGTVQRAGPVTFATVVMKRGIIGARHLWDWWSLFAGADGAENGGWASKNRCDVSIQLIASAGAKGGLGFGIGASAGAGASAGFGGAGAGFGAGASAGFGASASAGFGAGASAGFAAGASSGFGASAIIRGRAAVLGWKLENAMPVKFRVADLNAKGTDVAIEELHLVHEGLHMRGAA